MQISTDDHSHKTQTTSLDNSSPLKGLRIVFNWSRSIDDVSLSSHCNIYTLTAPQARIPFVEKFAVHKEVRANSRALSLVSGIVFVGELQKQDSFLSATELVGRDVSGEGIEGKSYT